MASTSLADMRTRLEDRMGYGSSSGVLSDQLDEALNAGIARAFADGVRGLQRDVFTGSTHGQTTAPVVAGATSGTSVTMDNGSGGDPSLHTTLHIAPQDILEFTSGDRSGEKVLIRELGTTSSNEETVIDLGVPQATEIVNNTTVKITRRAIKLPSSGSIVGVKLKDGRQLTYEPRNAVFDPYETGDPLYFEQRYSENTDTSYLILYPAPTSATVVTVIQNRAFVFDEAFDGPEEALDAILERAVLAFKTWQGQTSGTEAGLAIGAVRDTDNALHDASSAQKFFIRQ